MTNPSDRDLEKYLQGDSEISRLYQSGKDNIEPPAHLDKLILKTARENVKAKTGIREWLSKWFGNDWLTPATSAVMVVLMAVGVYMMLIPGKDYLDKAPESPVAEKSAPTGKPSSDKTVPVKHSTIKKDTKPSLIKKQPTGKTAQPDKTGYDRNSPESWLKHINTLYNYKKSDVARVEFIKFRKRYPNYPASKVLGKSGAMSLDPNNRRKKFKK